MNCDLSQYRASVGGFYCTMLRISTFRLNFVTYYDIVPFLSIFCLHNKGIGLALFYLFILSKLHNHNINGKCNVVYTTDIQQTNVYYDLTIDSMPFCLFLTFFICIFLMICNDVHPNPGPVNYKPSLSIVHNNIKSIRNKLDPVYVELNKFDIITLSETWLKSTIQQDEIRLHGYGEAVRRDRPDDSAFGGVAIYVKNNLICKPRPDLAVQDLEAVWVETRLNQDIILVGCFYRAPNMYVRYWDLIEESISKANNTPYKFIVIGDFNADCTERPPAHLSRIMAMNNLYQLVTSPTRHENGSSTTIDLILTPSPDIVSKVGVLPAIDSDHCAPYVELSDKTLTSQNFTFKRKLYNYSKLDENRYIDILQSVNWNEILTIASLDAAADKFTEQLMNAVNICVPAKIICMKENDEPWFTNEIRMLSNRKLRIHTLAKRLNSVWCWNLFKRLRNQLTDKIRKRKQEYLLDLENRVNERNNFGNKEWWKLVNNFSAKKGNSQSDIPPIQHEDKVYYHPQEKAQIFNNHFIKQSEIDGPDDIVPDTPVGINTIEHIMITKELVSKKIKELELNKSSGPDGIHNKMLLKGVDIISQPLASLFNRSIDEGTFPIAWKTAHVTPIYKLKGDKSVCANYRPISLLSCIGKILERCIHGYVFDFLRTNNLLTMSQSGFIPHDSTTFQLLSMYDDFCKALDNRIVTQCIYFDISKAFDRVWHKALLRKLYGIGIRGTLFSWFKDYLSNRTQAVVIKGKSSSYLKIPSGVPQGSVLGPLLFLIYINDITKDIESTIKLFADDTSIYLSIDDPVRRTTILNSDLSNINKWAQTWKVHFNPLKTELMTFSNRRNTDTRPLHFCGETLVETSQHKHLGVILQNDCKWDKHIHYIIGKIRVHTACLKSYKYKLSRKTLEIMYKSFILPHFDYSDVLWDNCSNLLKDELEKLNLDAIRTIIGAVRGTSHQKLYQESGFISLQERRIRHKLIIFYKMVNGIAPRHLLDRLPPLVSEHNPYHRRNPLERRIPFCRTELMKQSFFPSSTLAWNNLDDVTKSAPSIIQFKRKLAFNDVTVPKLYYTENRFSEIIHCKIRLQISDLNDHLFHRHLRDDSTCECGYQIENAHHFFFDCPLHIQARRQSISTIPNFSVIPLETFTHGDRNKSFADNKFIFEKVQQFIILSNRFN